MAALLRSCVLKLFERQERHNALAIAAFLIKYDFVGTRQHAFLHFQEQPLTRHVGRFLVFLVDLEEARGLALGFSHRLIAEAFGTSNDTVGLTLGARY